MRMIQRLPHRRFVDAVLHGRILGDFADQDHLRSLAEGGTQTVGEMKKSRPSSRWLKVDFNCGCMNSIGSSSVTTMTL